MIIGIESVPAVENPGSIPDVPGVDASFIGPNELSVSLDVPDQLDHPKYVEAVEHVIGAFPGRALRRGWRP